LFSSFLSEDYKSALGKEGQDLLHTIERAAERAFKLIDGMLAYARLDRAGEERIEVDLRAMLDQAMSNLTDLIEDTGARFDIDALPTVVAVEPQIMQLFQNLINNALKFRHPERPLLIRVRAKTMGPDSWRISVEDNGIGIAEKDQDRIFNMLERGHCQKNYEGSGIGLATCRRIVENHHGEIWCRSTKDVGSTFLFTLERENSATASADRRSSRTLPRRQWRPSPGRRLDVKSARSENAGLAPASFSVLAIRWFSDLHDAFTEACGRAGRTGFP
jgi:light-regulated signal transduction histidine kinase (bacteriophytochrome)